MEKSDYFEFFDNLVIDFDLLFNWLDNQIHPSKIMFWPYNDNQDLFYRVVNFELLMKYLNKDSVKEAANLILGMIEDKRINKVTIIDNVSILISYKPKHLNKLN